MSVDLPFETEALLATGYSLFLALISFILERVARHAHNRSRDFQTNGFTYHAPRDEWECPGGHPLERQHDGDNELMKYRAKAHLCNACHRKDECTDSLHGREIVLHQSPWVRTQVGRFQRGISLLLLAMAAFILLVEVYRYHDKPERLLFLPLLLVLAIAVSCSARGFFTRYTPLR